MRQTEPENGVVRVEVDKDIKVYFTDMVDTTTFNAGSVTFKPPLYKGFAVSWDGWLSEATLTLRDTVRDLKYSTKYEVKLSDRIKDTTGQKLDGDGEPGGDYVFCFATRAPEIEFGLTPGVQAMQRDDSSKYDGVFVNKEPRTLRLQLSAPSKIPSNYGWRHSLGQEEVELDSNVTERIPEFLTIYCGSFLRVAAAFL